MSNNPPQSGRSSSSTTEDSRRHSWFVRILSPDPWTSFGFLLGMNAVAWALFLSSSRKGIIQGSYIWVILLAFLALALGFSMASQRRFVGIQAIAIILLTFSFILVVFSSIYYSSGGAANFSQPLSRFDAFYVALGNLSTVGSGSIYPITEKARALVSIQYGVDILLVTGLISYILFRLSRRG
jgi:hypothetical protein